MLLTGDWFIECPPNFVPEEDKHLIPVPEPSAGGAVPMDIDLNDDDDDEAVQPEPAPKPKVQRQGKVRSRDGFVVTTPPVGVQIPKRASLASTQTSQYTFSNPPSPRRSNLDVESSQTLHVSHSEGQDAELMRTADCG